MAAEGYLEISRRTVVRYSSVVAAVVGIVGKDEPVVGKVRVTVVVGSIVVVGAVDDVDELSTVVVVDPSLVEVVLDSDVVVDSVDVVESVGVDVVGPSLVVGVEVASVGGGEA